MRIEAPKPISSFLSMEKDMNLIISKMLKNERLKRLLYYTTPTALEEKDLTREETFQLLGKNIKNIPKLQVDNEVLNYIIISFDNFSPTTNPEFRDNIIMFDIICHFNQWPLKDMQLRPYKIAGEIDSMFNNSRLTGIGKLEFMGSSQIILNNEFGGVCLCYKAYHDGEDKKHLTTPAQEEKFLQDFEKMMENKNGY